MFLLRYLFGTVLFWLGRRVLVFIGRMLRLPI